MGGLVLSVTENLDSNIGRNMFLFCFVVLNVLKADHRRYF